MTLIIDDQSEPGAYADKFRDAPFYERLREDVKYWQEEARIMQRSAQFWKSECEAEQRRCAALAADNRELREGLAGADAKSAGECGMITDVLDRGDYPELFKDAPEWMCQIIEDMRPVFPPSHWNIARIYQVRNITPTQRRLVIESEPCERLLASRVVVRSGRSSAARRLEDKGFGVFSQYFYGADASMYQNNKIGLCLRAHLLKQGEA